MGEVFGYARTSTNRQDYGLEDQVERLTAYGISEENIWSEQTSALGKRPQFEGLMRHLRSGDTLVITKLDRFARSLRDLISHRDQLDEKGVNLIILDMNLDSSTETGKLMLSVMGAINEFEVSILKSRQRIGIEKAKAEGKYKGRTPTARRLKEQIVQLSSEGLKPSQIASDLGIGVASVYRYRAT